MTETFDASNRKHVKLAAKASERDERARRQFITGVMSTATGRAWMLELLEGCHVFASSFSGNALQTAFAEGERNIGLRLLNGVMDACPDQYVVMMRERNVKEVVENERRTNNDNSAPGRPTGTDGRPIVEPGDD